METKRVYPATCCDFTVLSLHPDRTLDRRQGRIGPGRRTGYAWGIGGEKVLCLFWVEAQFCIFGVFE